MSALNGVLAIWYRELKVFLRERTRIMASVVNPLLWLLIFGGGLGSRFDVGGVNYQTFIFPGILVQAVLFSSIFFGVYIVWDRKIDFLKEVLVAPISRTSMFVGKIAGGTTDAFIQAVILIILGALLRSLGAVPGLRLTVATAAVSLAMLAVTAASMVGIGLIIGSRMESPEGFQLIGSFLLFPLFFLSGALFPIDRLPPWLAPLTLIDPLTYAVDGLRGMLVGAGHFPFLFDLGVMCGFLAVVICAGVFAFERMSV